MSTKAQVILDQIRSLAVKDQKDLWQELGRRIGQVLPGPAVEQYGEPLTDEDIEQSARVTFQSLAQFDAETRFRARASRGNPQRGLELLDKLDRGFERKSYHRRKI